MKIGNKHMQKSFIACENVLAVGNVNNWLINLRKKKGSVIPDISLKIAVLKAVYASALLNLYKKMRARLPRFTKKTELYSY